MNIRCCFANKFKFSLEFLKDVPYIYDALIAEEVGDAPKQIILVSVKHTIAPNMESIIAEK